MPAEWLSSKGQGHKDVVAEVGASDDLTRTVSASYLEFRTLLREWSEVGEGAYQRVRSFGE